MAEGLFYGFFGSLIGTILVFIVALAARQSINAFFTPIEFISNNLSVYGLTAFVEILFGCLIGLLASWIGVKRYIKF